ncbi:MarR family winged helix-turn-helix transcriptional regulator [Spirochaeta lutea]|uniref:HTH marR-type domain-containing protein n=1 Tax=Spirochaeta lutea TaxID=1480694 RepID=A0A098QYJ2_9SPIO|nr:MarR family transcriptional regulator [Spirochaeta lutea]KGE72734.1 hypothetical protein DC28_06770 [Spirochaeta lutea]
MSKDPSLDAFIKLTRATDSVHQSLAGTFAGLADLSQPEFEVLEALYHKGPLCQKQISQKVLKSKGRISQQIEVLEKRGLLTRIQEDFDKRQFRCELTEAGRNTIAPAFETVRQTIQEIFSVLSTEEQQGLSALCRILGTGRREQDHTTDTEE